MLSKLYLKNYKAFEGESFEVKPITMILGPNNSGKSSVLSAARVLSQTITSYGISVPFLLNGGLGNFGTYKDVVYGNSKRKHIEISFSIKETLGNTPLKDQKSINCSNRTLFCVQMV